MYLRKIVNLVFLSVLGGIIFISGCGMNASKENNSSDNIAVSPDEISNQPVQNDNASSNDIGFDIEQVGTHFW